MSSLLAQGCQAAFADVVALDQCLQAKAKWVSRLFGVTMMMQSNLNQGFPETVSPTPSSLLPKTSVPYSEICDRS